MATKKGIWNLQQVRDKQLQSLWSYAGSGDEPGTLWGWGDGSTGRLGHNNTTRYSSPVQVGSGDSWNDLGSDGRILSTNGGIKDDGTLWVWGDNSDGKLGQNQAPAQLGQVSAPIQIPGTTWSKFTRSSNMVAGIKSDNTLWMWGRGKKGGLGQNTSGSNSYYSSPVQVPGTWSSVSCAYGYTGAVKTDGTLWTWGINTDGQLGHNETTEYSSPVQVPGTNWAFTYVAERELWASKTNGELYGIGLNNVGQLGQNTSGDNSFYSSPVQIPGTWAVGKNKMAAGYFNFYGVKGDGTLWSWGTGGYNSNGHNNQTEYSSPVQIGAGTDWTNVAAGTVQAGAIKTDATLWTWGKNSDGQLGQNSRTTINSPVQVPGSWRLGDGSLISGWGGFMALKQP